MFRRDVLRSMAGGGVIGTVTAQNSRTENHHPVAQAEYDRRLDVVEDIGVDDTGATPIDADLQPYLRDDTLLEFPDGRYLIDALHLYKRSNFGLVGTGDATLVPGDYPRGDDVWIGGGAVRNLHFEGFRLDTRGTGPGVGFAAYDGLLVRDIEKVGVHTTTRTAFGFEIWESDGAGRIEGLRATDGDVFQTQVGANALYTKTNGTLSLVDCRLAGWGDNGVYASDATGPVRIEGGYFADSNVSQVRLSSPGSYVRGARIEVDREGGPGWNLRGVRVNDGPGPVEIVDCDIVMRRGRGNGGVVVSDDGGSVAVRDSRIFVGESYLTPNPLEPTTGFAIQVDTTTGFESAPSFVLENTAITGGGTNGGAVLFQRGNVRVANTCINQTGSRNGITFKGDTGNNTVENSSLTVRGIPIRHPEAAVETRDVNTGGTCSLPASVNYEQSQPEGDPESDRTPSTTPAATSATLPTSPTTGSNGSGEQPTAETTSTAPGFGPAIALAGLTAGALLKRVSVENGPDRTKRGD